jgi:hypothetical protein
MFNMKGTLSEEGDTADMLIKWEGSGGTTNIHVKIDEISTEFEGTFFTDEYIKGAYCGLKNTNLENIHWSG